MLHRSHILSLAAVAMLASGAFATSASANQPIYKNGVHLQANPGLIKPTTPIVKPIQINPGLHLSNPSSPPSLPPAVAIKKPIDIDCVSFHDCDHDHDHDGDHHHWGFWWHQPHLGVIGYETVGTAPIIAAPVSAAVGTAAPAPCNCLNKRYLQDGSVLFTDLCTKEQAMATPDELRAQAQGVSPQAQ
jgi:hypothetical protein